MPSTGWNVFVASLVALVVYIAVQAEMVLLGIVAGTLTFVSGWLLGYAINQDLLDSMELSRLAVAGGVTVFAIVYTLLYTNQQYILGLIVVCLVWFAAWFTSSMGPIKGNTGAMETIDEPRPPAGAEPGEPLHLGGPEEKYNDDGSGFLGGLLGFGGDETEYTTEPEGQSSDSTTQPTETQSSTTTSEGSIFGLGIFYEEEPAADAGADDGPPARAEPDQPSEPARTEPATNDHAAEPPTDPPEQQRRPAATDHTRPSSTGPVSATVDDTSTDGAGVGREQNPRREPPDSPGRDTGHPDAAAAESDTSGESWSDDAETGEEEPPDEHRVDVEDDDGGFIFG